MRRAESIYLIKEDECRLSIVSQQKITRTLPSQIRLGQAKSDISKTNVISLIVFPRQIETGAILIALTKEMPIHIKTPKNNESKHKCQYCAQLPDIKYVSVRAG